jgi:hypothetical protein
MHAQAPAPKPNPELKKLQAYVGHWTVEGEMNPPSGPAIKISGTYDGKMTLGGFYFQGLARNKESLQAVEYFGYDPVNRNIVGNTYAVDGTQTTWVATISGNTVSWTGKAIAAAGEQYSVRGRDVFTADFMSITSTLERSSDGKTWVPFFEGKWTKAAAPAKK